MTARTEFLEEVVLYLNELVEVLFREEYFGFKDSAYEYVDDIIDTVISGIDRMPRKRAPEYFNRYGKDMEYVTYRKNRDTQWHVFFKYADGVYQVRYIGNNHNIGQYL